MARNLYAEVTARILAELDAGAAPWIKPWRSKGLDGTPRNAITRRPYSGGNVIMLWMAQSAHGFRDMRFLTFKQALEAGGNVRKGEKGTTVYFVSKFEKRDEATDEVKRIPFLKAYTVFNISQCENLDELAAPAPAPVSEARRDEIADEFMAATGAEITEGVGEAYYTRGADRINLPALASFKSADHFYNTAFHELGHWTGHKSRLDREFGKRFGDGAYAMEELVAELTAAFLCGEFGYDGDLRHAGYMATWADVLRKDERAFFTVASRAQAAADYLRGLALREPIAEAA